ncbi:autophagy-related protein 22-like protein [Xylariaceae sp. FL1272]|nr:autophagy-related protein 22-like protein [Xylariaceae sp. FL1272]
MSSAPDPALVPQPVAQDVHDVSKLNSDVDASEHGGIVVPALTSAEIPETSKWEIWSWYAYYIGANGLALFNFGPTIAQNLLSQAAPEDTGLLPFAGQERNVNSIVLVANGISFAIQAVLFIIIGSYADFGTGRRWILIFWSILAYAIGFAWLGVHTPDKWQTGIGLYIVGLICYQLTLTYWTAAFPALARNTPLLKEAARAYADGEITHQEYDHKDEMERSRLSNIAFYIQSVGEIVILAIIVGILFGVKANASTENNNLGQSVLIAFSTGVWLLLSIPWFLIEKKRPGLKVPPGQNMVTVGFWQLKEALGQIWHLKMSLVYLVGYFLLGDSLNTTVTVIATLQNEIVAYDTLTLTYLFIVGIAAQGAGIGIFWLIQKRYKLGAKTMFNCVMIGIILLDGWGMIGNWTNRFGFHRYYVTPLLPPPSPPHSGYGLSGIFVNLMLTFSVILDVWEVWVYQVFYGLFVCPWYSYSQIMISSVTPRGHEFLFFSLFTIIGKTSSFIGPFVSSAIIDRTPNHDNNNAAFYFLFALSLVSAAGLWIFLDLEKSAREQEAFIQQEKARMAAGSDSE